MKKRNKILILVVSGILLLIAIAYYYGLVYSFRNYGNGGNGYPLAVYALPVNLGKANSLIDSLSKTGTFRVEPIINSPGKSSSYLSMGQGSTAGDTTYEIECIASASKDSTTIYLWGIYDKTDSITPYSSHDNKTGFDKKKSRFENVFVRQLGYANGNEYNK